MEHGQNTGFAEKVELEPFRYLESPLALDRNLAAEALSVSFPEIEGYDSVPAPNRDGETEQGPMHQRAFDLSEAQEPAVRLEFLTLNGSEAEGCSADTGLRERENADGTTPGLNSNQDPATEQQFEQKLTVEIQSAEVRGRDKGVEMGLIQGREECARQLQTERERLYSQAASLIKSFAAARESCLHDLEQEAAHLALAIAARILRREAQMDPLLLMGSVRVAIGQLAKSTSVRLRVPAQDQPMWEEALSHAPGLEVRIQVIGEAHMELGECRMESELGDADLGLWPQLKAVERGFFDRSQGATELSGNDSARQDSNSVFGAAEKADDGNDK